MSSNNATPLPYRLCALFFLLCHSYSFASPTAQYFDLPQQPLGQALIEFALQAEVAVFAPYPIIHEATNTPIIGPFSADKALTLLLGRSGLSFDYDTPSNTYTITRPKIKPQKTTQQSASNTIEEQVVTGARYPFRYQTIANSRLRNGVSTFDSTRFHNRISKTIINDIAANDIVGALQLTSGITPGSNLFSTNDNVFIRGFQRNAVHVDNFKLSTTSTTKIDPDMVNAIEVLKGPSTLLYGQAEAGGMVNIQRKIAMPTSQGRVAITGSNSAPNKVYIDLNAGQINAQPLNSRLQASLLDGESQSQHGITRQTLNWDNRWQINPALNVHFNYEIQRIEQELNRDVAVLNSIQIHYTLEDITRLKNDTFNTDYTLLHTGFTYQLTPQWKLHGQYAWQEEAQTGVHSEQDSSAVIEQLFINNTFDSDDLLLIFGNEVALPLITNNQGAYLGNGTRIYDEENNESVNQWNLSLEGVVDVANINHRLSLGTERYTRDKFNTAAFEKIQPNKNNFTTENINDLRFWQGVQATLEPLLSPSSPLGPLSYNARRALYHDLGAYGQVHSEWTATLATTFGARYSQFTIEHDKLFPLSQNNQNTLTNLSIQAGAVLQPTTDLSLFYNYSESAHVNDAFFFALSDQGIEQAAQNEIGFKWLGLGGRLYATGAFFDITKNNATLMFFDPQQSEIPFDQFNLRVTGIEGDTTLQISEATQIIASASILDATISQGVYQGNRAPMAADMTLAFMLRQEFLHDWSASIKMNYAGDRSSDPVNSTTLKAFVQWDGNLTYQKNQWSANLIIRNLMDERYIVAVQQGRNLTPAEPRTISLRADYSF